MTRLLVGGCFLNPAIALVLLASVVPANAALLSVTIEDEGRAAVLARVYLLDDSGRPVFPPNTIRYEMVRSDDISERHFIPVAGTFKVDLKEGTYRLTVERGKEYLAETVSLAVPASGELNRTIQLHRWVNMAGRGWFSADMHVHRSLSELTALMQAEDLSVAIPISHWKTKQLEQHDPDLDRFLSAADRDGVYHTPDGRLFPVLNEELEPRASALLASWLDHKSVPLLYPLERFGKAVQSAGGLSDSEKASSLELPALAALSAFDTVGLVNNHIWRSHSYAESGVRTAMPTPGGRGRIACQISIRTPAADLSNPGLICTPLCSMLDFQSSFPQGVPAVFTRSLRDGVAFTSAPAALSLRTAGWKEFAMANRLSPPDLCSFCM